MKNIRTWRIFQVYLSRSGNKRISYWTKKNYLAFFSIHIWVIRHSHTFFLALSVVTYIIFWTRSCPSWKFCTASFFSKKKNFNTKIAILFKMVKFNLIFLFLVTYGSFSPVCARKDTAPSQFLIPIFDYFWLFDYWWSAS